MLLLQHDAAAWSHMGCLQQGVIQNGLHSAYESKSFVRSGGNFSPGFKLRHYTFYVGITEPRRYPPTKGNSKFYDIRPSLLRL